MFVLPGQYYDQNQRGQSNLIRELLSESDSEGSYTNQRGQSNLIRELLNESDSEGSYADYIYLDGQLLAMYQKHNVNGYTGSQISTSVDNTDATTSQTGVWASTTSNQQCFNGADYLLSDISGNNTFIWPLDLSDSSFGEGDYYVFASWGAHSAYSDKARYTVHTNTGDHEFTVDQRYDAIDYDTGITYSKFMWGYLGKIHFSGTGGEYIKLDDATSGGKPVSADGVRIIKVRPPSFTEELFYIQNDHLGQPQRVFDQNRAVVWQGVFNAWGAGDVGNPSPDNEAKRPVLNLRFPGQYYDQETGLHYNYYRDYDPSTGRYLESDPIGLEGGLNTYAYVKGNPLRYVDSQGTNPLLLCLAGGLAAGTGQAIGTFFQDDWTWGDVGSNFTGGFTGGFVAVGVAVTGGGGLAAVAVGAGAGIVVDTATTVETTGNPPIPPDVPSMPPDTPGNKARSR